MAATSWASIAFAAWLRRTRTGHSSARLERYLQLAAQNNWRVADCSTSAQYFHLLRQQAMYLRHDARPLVLMTPKSLLRNPLSSAKLTDLTDKTFQPVLDDEGALHIRCD